MTVPLLLTVDHAEELLRPRLRHKKKVTRRDRFLAEINSVTPWDKLHKLAGPFCPIVKDAGRAPINVARMLRMYLAQQCFGLSDKASKIRFMTASPFALLSASLLAANRHGTGRPC